MKNTKPKNSNQKSSINTSSKINKSDPKNLKFFKNLVGDNFHNPVLIVFQSIYNELIMIYRNNKRSIILYSLTDFKIITEIKNSQKYINEMRYYFDKFNKRDLLASIEMNQNNIKLWNINTWELIVDINYNIGNFFLNINSINFLENKDTFYLVASSINIPNHQLIHIYDLNGTKIKEINDPKSKSSCVETFYDTKTFKNYIIIATNDDIRAIDYQQNKIFKKYISVEGKSKVINEILPDSIRQRLPDNITHIKKEIPLKGPTHRIIVNNYNNITKIFAAENDGFVRIWNFHTGNLLSSISISKPHVFDICLWDEGLLLAGHNGGVKLIDLKNNKIIKNLDEIGEGRGLAVIEYKQYGKCLITENLKGLNLWINKYA